MLGPAAATAAAPARHAAAFRAAAAQAVRRYRCPSTTTATVLPAAGSRGSRRALSLAPSTSFSLREAAAAGLTQHQPRRRFTELSKQAIMTTQAAIEAKLTADLKPTHLQVLNESHMHNVPKDSETHFKVIVVSAAFEGQGLLARHRRINALLSQELQGGVHALSMVCKTPAEWEAAGGAGSVAPSPQCRGGSKH